MLSNYTWVFYICGRQFLPTLHHSEEFKNAKITPQFGFDCKKTRPVKIECLLYHHRRRFQIPQAWRQAVKNVFEKLPFSVVRVLNRINKPAIRNFSGVAWILPHFQGNLSQTAVSRLTPGFGNSMISLKWPHRVTRFLPTWTQSADLHEVSCPTETVLGLLENVLSRRNCTLTNHISSNVSEIFIQNLFEVSKKCPKIKRPW